MHSYSICKTLVPTLPLIFHFEYFTNICRDSFGKLNISYRLSKRKKRRSQNLKQFGTSCNEDRPALWTEGVVSLAACPVSSNKGSPKFLDDYSL